MDLAAKTDDPRFQWVIRGEGRGVSDLFDVPVYDDPDAVAVPSIGSLVPGWTLIVPKKPAPNLASISAEDRRSLQAARSLVYLTLGAGFEGTVYEFEHGANGYGSVMGCGVDQAHLHVVPLPFDLVGVSNELNGLEKTCFSGDTSDPWSAITSGADYLLIRDATSGQGVIVYPATPESQSLRRLIAKHIGGPEWDYKKNRAPINAEITRRAFLAKTQ